MVCILRSLRLTLRRSRRSRSSHNIQSDPTLADRVLSHAVVRQNCEQLGLSSNNIDKIGNLAGMEKLKILSLGLTLPQPYFSSESDASAAAQSIGRNLIKKLDNLDGLGNKLEQLWISYNSLSSLSGVEKLKTLKVRPGDGPTYRNACGDTDPCEPAPCPWDEDTGEKGLRRAWGWVGSQGCERAI